MNEKLDIFIGTHKDFDCKVTNPIYKIISNCELKNNYNLECYCDNIGDNISKYNPYMNEMTMFFWLYKNYQIKDYIGFCHYRRYFSFLDNVIDVENILNNNDIILLEKTKFICPVYKQYSHCHNLLDLKELCEIIHKLYPEYDQSCYDVLNGNELYSCNMFIMKRDDFIKYCDFAFNVFFEFMSNNDYYDINNIEKHVIENSNSYLKTFSPNDTIAYQKRFIGFLSERLFSIFVCHNFKKIYNCDFIFTE